MDRLPAGYRVGDTTRHVYRPNTRTETPSRPREGVSARGGMVARKEPEPLASLARVCVRRVYALARCRYASCLHAAEHVLASFLLAVNSLPQTSQTFSRVPAVR